MKVKKCNEAVRAYQNFKVFEQKIIMAMLSKVQEDDENGKEYQITSAEIQKLMGMDDRKPILKFFNMCEKEIDVTEVESAFDIAKRNEKSREIMAPLLAFGEEKTSVAIFDKLTYDKKIHGLRFKLADTFKQAQCRPLDEGGFIMYDYKYIKPLKSEYKIRIYEICLSYKSMENGYTLWFSQLLNQVGFTNTKRVVNIKEDNPIKRKTDDENYGNVKASEFALKFKNAINHINEHMDIYVFWEKKYNKAGNLNGFHLHKVVDNPIRAVEKAEETLDKEALMAAMDLLEEHFDDSYVHFESLVERLEKVQATILQKMKESKNANKPKTKVFDMRAKFSQELSEIEKEDNTDENTENSIVYDTEENTTSSIENAEGSAANSNEENIDYFAHVLNGGF